HAFPLVHGGLARVMEASRVAAVHLDRDEPIAVLVLVLLDRVAGVGSAGSARHGCHRASGAAADLMSQHPSGDTADHGAQSRRFAFFLDEADGDDLSAIAA